jgi:hypothetical protein
MGLDAIRETLVNEKAKDPSDYGLLNSCKRRRTTSAIARDDSENSL